MGMSYEVIAFGLTNPKTGEGFVVTQWTPEGPVDKPTPYKTVPEALKDDWEPFSERQAKLGPLMWLKRVWRKGDRVGNLVDETESSVPVPGWVKGDEWM